VIALPEDITSKDVNQWLCEGWFYVKHEGELKIARYITSISEHSTLVRTLDDEELTVPHSWLFAHWPACGSINIVSNPKTGFAAHLVRLQKKQWKRTYNTYCLKMRPISDQQDHFTFGADGEAVVRAAFNPEYFTYTEVLKHKFPEGWVSCAINPSLIVMKVPDQQMVYVDGEVVGLINDTTKFFTCVNPGIKRRLLPHFDYMVE
jgi:hypothetical protein